MTDRAERATTLGDRRAAFEALADAELDGAYRLAGVILGDPWQAEDATHDAVVQAWLRYGSLRDPDRFGAWFQRILVNGCRDRLRQRSRRPVAVLTPDRAVTATAPGPSTTTSTSTAPSSACRRTTAWRSPCATTPT